MCTSILLITARMLSIFPISARYRASVCWHFLANNSHPSASSGRQLIIRNKLFAGFHSPMCTSFKEEKIIILLIPCFSSSCDERKRDDSILRMCLSTLDHYVQFNSHFPLSDFLKRTYHRSNIDSKVADQFPFYWSPFLWSGILGPNWPICGCNSVL